MALNAVFKPGQSVSLPIADAVSGDAVRLGVLNGVAVVDSGDGFNEPGFVSVDLFGAHLFELTGGAAADVGDPVYITSGGDLTLTVGSNKLFGAITHKHRGNFVVVLTQAISV